MPRIRALALCVFRDRGRILVAEAEDTVSGQRFCRPLGGGIEFGETSAQAVEREIREELGVEVTGLQLLGTLENLFTWLGEPGHEIVLVHDGAFVDEALYAQASIAGIESDGTPLRAVWRDLRDFSPALPLYPEGLLQLLHTRD